MNYNHTTLIGDERSEQQVTMFLTRHTKTTANAIDLIQGWSDFPLTQEGIEIARQFGRGLQGIRFAAAYCGTLTRHYETARIALDNSGNDNVEIRFEPGLREYNFGSFEGRDVSTTHQAVAEWLGYSTVEEARAARGPKFDLDVQNALYALDAENVLHTDLVPQDRAESADMVEQRMWQAMTNIGDTVSREGGGDVLVISSGTAIRQFLWTIDSEVDLTYLGNTAVTKVDYNKGTFSIEQPVGSMAYYERGAQ